MIFFTISCHIIFDRQMQPTLRQSCPTSSNAKTGRGKTLLYSLQSSLLSARFPLHQWIFGQTEPLPNELRELFTLPRAHGVLGIPDLKPEAPQQYAASKLITVPHVGTIRTQGTFMPVGEQIVEDLKRQQQSLKTRAANLRREAIDASLSPNLPRSTMKATDKGVSSWLNAVPFEEQGLTLNKQQFRDSLSLRYNLQLADLPSHCPCRDWRSIHSQARPVVYEVGFCCTQTRWHPKLSHVSAQPSLQECRGRTPSPDPDPQSQALRLD